MKEFDVKVDLKDFHGRPVAIVHLPGIFRVLSSTIMGGGFTETDTIFILEVKMGYDNSRPEEDLEMVCKELHLGPRCVGFMTAADVRRVLTVTRDEIHGKRAITVATAGVTNAVCAGERLPQEVIDLLPKHQAGTINIISISDAPLQDCGLAGAFITMTEAKGAALKDTGVPGTGTTSDAVAIACPLGEGDKYAGPATDTGMAIARSVREAVGESIRKWNKNGNGGRDFVYRLDELGLGPEELWKAAFDLSITGPASDIQAIKTKFLDHLSLLRKDANVNTLIYAAIIMDEMSERGEMSGLDHDGSVADGVPRSRSGRVPSRDQRGLRANTLRQERT